MRYFISVHINIIGNEKVKPKLVGEILLENQQTEEVRILYFIEIREGVFLSFALYLNFWIGIETCSFVRELDVPDFNKF